LWELPGRFVINAGIDDIKPGIYVIKRAYFVLNDHFLFYPGIFYE